MNGDRYNGRKKKKGKKQKERTIILGKKEGLKRMKV